MTKAGKSESVRKKNLGQYFTDRKVGRLLAALANASAAKSIIDPMVGSANLLQACLSVGAAPDRLVGVELDPVALDEAHRALQGQSDVELILGDAFDVPLPTSQFDLVITNPPYIRYQSKADVDGISVPTSAGVRSGLIRAINGRVELTQEERESLLRVAIRHSRPCLDSQRSTCQERRRASDNRPTGMDEQELRAVCAKSSRRFVRR